MASAMVPVGRLQVATPMSMALAIRNATEAQKAVDERIAPVAGDIIEGLDPLVFDGPAERAVDAQVSDRALVEQSNARLLNASAPEGFEVVDTSGRVGLRVRAGDGVAEIPRALIGGAKHVGGAGWSVTDASGHAAIWVDEQTGDVRIPRLVGGPGQQRVHVLVVAGQSLAVGQGLPVSAELDPADSRILMWDWDSSSLKVATVPLSTRGTRTGLSPATVMAHRLATEAGAMVVIVNAARGDTGVTVESANGRWQVGYAGANDDLLTIAKVAVSSSAPLIGEQFPGAVVTASLLWHQGERDASQSADRATYETQLDAVLLDLRSAIAAAYGVDSVPVTTGGMVPEYVGSIPARLGILAAIADTPRRIPGVAFVPVPANVGGSAGMSDTVHPSREGVELTGRAHFDALTVARCAIDSTPPRPPVRVDIARVGDQVTVAWSTPWCRVTGYVVETSVTGAGGWTAVPLDEPMQQTVTITSSAPVWVRVTTITPGGDSLPTTPKGA